MRRSFIYLPAKTAPWNDQPVILPLEHFPINFQHLELNIR